MTSSENTLDNLSVPNSIQWKALRAKQTSEKEQKFHQ